MTDRFPTTTGIPADGEAPLQMELVEFSVCGVTGVSCEAAADPDTSFANVNTLCKH